MFVQMQAFGKVERDPELVVTKGGIPFTEFPLAINTKRCVQDITVWLTCHVWGDQAETLQRSGYQRCNAVRPGPFHPAPVHDWKTANRN